MTDPTPSFLRTWGLAVRPWAYPASVTPAVLGFALAYYAGYAPRWGLFLLTLLGVVMFHTAANLLNDCFDHRRGLDTEVFPMSGAIVRGLLTERQIFRAAMLFLSVGIVIGVVLVWIAGWPVLLLGICGALLASGYTGPAYCFKYAGLGDLAIFLAFGVIPVFGAYWVQTQAFSWLPLVWSLPLVSYTVGILHANNWRDIGSDTQKRCRTVAGALGESGSAVYYRLLVLGPFALVGAFVAAGFMITGRAQTPWTTLVVLLALPLAIKLSRVRRERSPDVFAMLDGKTAQMNLVFGVLLTVAFVAARLFHGGR